MSIISSELALSSDNVTTWNIFSVPSVPGQPDIFQAVTLMVFCNKAISSETREDDITVYLVPGSDSNTFINPGSDITIRNKNMIINRLVIPPGETFTFDSEKIILKSGDSIKAICTYGDIVCTVSSVDLT